MLARRREEMASILDEVTSLGVVLALDDFGTGYSSLSLLQDLPVHVLKIDRAFVHSIDTMAERRAFVKAIVELGESLQLVVAAEGIESEAQAVELRRLGCRLAQGYHFARPLEPQQLVELFTRGLLTLSGARRSEATLRPEAA